MYHAPLASQCVYGHSDQRDKNGDGEDKSEISEGVRKWRSNGLLYADDAVLCSESEEVLRAMLGRFVEVCRRRGRKSMQIRAK